MSRLHVGQCISGVGHVTRALEELLKRVVIATEQAITRPGLDRTGHGLVAVPNLVVFHIDGDFQLRIHFDRLGQNRAVGVAGDHANHAEIGRVAEEDFSKASRNDGLVARTENRLRRVFARTAAAKVIATQKDGGFSKAWIVEIVLFILAALSLTHVVEEVVAEAVEGDALHEARRNDAVGIDVVAGNEDAFTGQLFNGCGWHNKLRIADGGGLPEMAKH